MSGVSSGTSQSRVWKSCGDKRQMLDGRATFPCYLEPNKRFASCLCFNAFCKTHPNEDLGSANFFYLGELWNTNRKIQLRTLWIGVTLCVVDHCLHMSNKTEGQKTYFIGQVWNSGHMKKRMTDALGSVYCFLFAIEMVHVFQKKRMT